jgi:hybrid cluster-associated redox disulfide protein
MVVSNALQKHPNLAKVFINFGLPCLVCEKPFWGTINELAEKHEGDVKSLVEELNKNMEKSYEKL